MTKSGILGVLFCLLGILSISTSSMAQSKLRFGFDIDQRYSLWVDNLEYIRKPFGANHGLGGHVALCTESIGFKLSYMSYNEGFRDVVKDDVRFFEYFDTVTAVNKLRYAGLGIIFPLIKRKLTIDYEGEFFLSKWKYSTITGYAPNKVVKESFTGSEKQFKNGVVLRNGLRMGYVFNSIVISGSIFTDILLKRYWSENVYISPLEPYPRAAIGGRFSISFIFNRHHHAKSH